MDVTAALTVVVVAYALGSVPSGYLVGRWFGTSDVRQFGSKRTGATNVLRLHGRRAAAIAVCGDFAKGAAAIAFSRTLTGSDPWADFLAGIFAIVGHNYPVFLRFRGGRGVAVGAAVTVIMVPLAALWSTVVFVGTIAATRYVSLGSVLAAVAVLPVAAYAVVTLGNPPQHFFFALVSCGLVVYSHRDNIARLRRGTERRLGESAKTSTSGQGR
ncbi:MAG: glycerol-3-phosphate 1-O-acyltransferase PlsY [Chloroflexota bacterium]